MYNYRAGEAQELRRESKTELSMTKSTKVQSVFEADGE